MIKPKSVKVPVSLSHQELNLSFGEITEEAALEVARSVQHKDQLKRLDLNGTNTHTLTLKHKKCHGSDG